jgi:hypothetical protein
MGGMILPGDIWARIEGFERELPELLRRFEGIELREQAMRRYETIMVAIPRQFLDQAHDALYACLCSQGLARKDGRALPRGDARQPLGDHPAGT